MATFYIQLEDRLLQISGEITAENIAKALGYVPANIAILNNYATKGDISPLANIAMVEELSQRVDNISFENLKDNPFTVDDSGEFNIVDEQGNIVAKISSQGLQTVDVIAGQHVLSNKADLEILDNYSTKEDLEDFTQEVYANYATKEELTFENIDNNPLAEDESGNLTIIDSENNIGLLLNEDGLRAKEVFAGDHVLSNKAENSVVEEISNKVNTLIGEDSNKSVRAIANEELLTQLLEGNDNFQTLQELAAWIDEHPEDASAMNEQIQQNKSDITALNDAYKMADIENLAEAKEYTDLINFHSLKENPFVVDETGELNIVDESGNIGFKLGTEGVSAKDFTAGSHILSNKADKSYTDDKVTQINTNINNKVTQINTTIDTKVSEINTNIDTQVQQINETINDSVEELNNAINELSQNSNSSDAQVLRESKEYTDSAVSNISFQDINNNPVTVDEIGEFNIVDENGNIGLKLNSSGLYVQDVTSGNHTLSLKANQSALNDTNQLLQNEINRSTKKESELEQTINDLDSTLNQSISDLNSDYTQYKEDTTNNINQLTTDYQEADTDTLNNSKEYTDSKFSNVQFEGLQGNPIQLDDSGEFSITDEDGNVGLKLNSDGIYVQDVTAGDHKLSNKQDSLVSGENIKTINGESLIGNGDIIIMGGNVIQTVTTTDASYPLLFAPAGQTATTTTESFFNTGIYANASTKSLYATHFYETSDKQFKDNIQPILNSDNCPEIKQFNWKENGQQSYGFIAQELEELGYKELVSTDETGKKTVNYSAALSLVVGKMSAKILELEQKIIALESKLN